MKFLTITAAFLAIALAAQVQAADPPAAVVPPAPAPPPAQPQPPLAGPRPADKLDLDTASIRGNQELPKVLYIVPWKEPGLAEPAGRPLNSLVDEALAPVDREVFRRQMRYFDQLYPAAKAAGSDEAAAGGK